MKKIIRSFALASILFIAFSCNENDNLSPDNKPSDEEVLALTIAAIQNNSGIFNEILEETIITVTDTVKRVKAKSKTREMFIENMDKLTGNIFIGATLPFVQDLQLSTVPQPFAGEAEITLKAIVNQHYATTPVNAVLFKEYSDSIIDLIESMEKSGKDNRQLVQFYAGDLGNPVILPESKTTLNAEQLKFLAKTVYTVMDNSELTEEEKLKDIDKIINRMDLPPVAIALLLPAVQKFKETGSSTAASEEPMQLAISKWVDNSIPQPIQGALDRDIIRRRCIMATFLAGLHTLATNDYRNTNQNEALLSLMHARYRAMLILTWNELWNLEW